MADPISSTARKPWSSIEDDAPHAPVPGRPAAPRPSEPPYEDIRAYAPPPAASAPSASGATAGAAGPDLTFLPDSLLDRQATALRSRLGRPADYPERSADRGELAKVEDELSRRAAASRPPTDGGHVEICKRKADIPVLGPLGLQHHWLKTSTKEAGMGPARGNIPGHGDSLQNLPGDPTTINDHSAETQKHCEPVPGVTEDCVNDRLRIGAYTGRWTPPLNDCQTFVADVIADCTQKNVDEALSHGRRGNEPGPAGTR